MFDALLMKIYTFVVLSHVIRVIGVMVTSENQKRFETIYLEYFQAIRDFCSSYLKDEELARDVAQDSFFSLWNHFNPVFSEKEILSFLYTSARNKCLDHLRLQKVIESKFQELKDEVYGEEFFLDEVTRNETYRIVRGAVNKLPERSRQIATLTLQGYSLQEIADELSVSINTVKTLKKNAYEKLREMISNQYIVSVLLKIFI